MGVSDGFRPRVRDRASLELPDDQRVRGDSGGPRDFFPNEEVEFSGGLRGQRFEAFSTDFVDFFGSLPEGHAEADEEWHNSDQQHGDDQFGLEPPSSRGGGGVAWMTSSRRIL